MLSKLMKLAEEFNVAVFITNQVVADPGANAMFVAGILPHMFLSFTTLSSVIRCKEANRRSHLGSRVHHTSVPA